MTVDEQHDQKPDTRLWMGGVEVQFVGWTNYGLVYTRVGSMQTLANLTKSTVRRLQQDGTLRVEGYRPDWADPELFDDGEHVSAGGGAEDSAGDGAGESADEPTL